MQTTRVNGASVESVASFNFVAGVPAKVTGAELELAGSPAKNWDIGFNLAYARSKISGASVPCSDYLPADGVPDAGGAIPTAAQIRAATGGQNIAVCSLSLTPSTSPKWSASGQSEYRVPLSSKTDGFVRGLVTWYGRSINDATNAIDDITSYALVNLYAGVRDSSGAWELSAYAKNLTNTLRVLSRNSSPLIASYRAGPAAVNGTTNYRAITVNNPREFGLNLRFAFGSR